MDKNLLENIDKRVDKILDEIDLKRYKNKASEIKSNIARKARDVIDKGKVEAREVGSLVNQLKREGGAGAAVAGASGLAMLVLPGGIMASLILYAGYKTYVRNFSGSSKKCDKALTGKQKDLCIKQIKRMAVEKHIDDLKNGLSSCDQPEDISNNKYRCMRIINTKIKKLEKRAEYLKKQESSIVL